MAGEVSRFGKLAPAIAIGSVEVRVAKSADRMLAIPFQTAPEIAARETEEDGRAPRLATFALDREKGLFDGIGHGHRK